MPFFCTDFCFFVPIVGFFQISKDSQIITRTQKSIQKNRNQYEKLKITTKIRKLVPKSERDFKICPTDSQKPKSVRNQSSPKNKWNLIMTRPCNYAVIFKSKMTTRLIWFLHALIWVVWNFILLKYVCRTKNTKKNHRTFI